LSLLQAMSRGSGRSFGVEKDIRVGGGEGVHTAPIIEMELYTGMMDFHMNFYIEAVFGL
jgi:hypothetical protein